MAFEFQLDVYIYEYELNTHTHTPAAAGQQRHPFFKFNPSAAHVAPKQKEQRCGFDVPH